MGNSLPIHDLIKTLHIIHFGYTYGYFLCINIFQAVNPKCKVFKIFLVNIGIDILIVFSISYILVKDLSNYCKY